MYPEKTIIFAAVKLIFGIITRSRSTSNDYAQKSVATANSS